MQFTHRKTLLLSFFLTLFFVACSPKHEDYTDNWIGNWKSSDNMELPMKAGYENEGTITKDSDTRNRIIISGTLFGLNSSYKIPAKVNSERRATVTFDEDFSVNGEAYFNGKDTIKFFLNVKQDNRSVYDTLTAVKVR